MIDINGDLTRVNTNPPTFRPRFTFSVVAMFASAAFLSLPHETSSHAQEPSTRRWFERSIVGMEVGPTGAQFGYSDPADTRYCRVWNGREIVKKCVEANAEYLVLWLRDGDYAYYNSKLLPKAPGLGDRDPLREAMDEAKKHDLPIISYCVVQQGGIYLKEHPEWQMRGFDGGTFGRFCYNSGLSGSDEEHRRRATGVRHRWLSHRHARSGLWQALRMLVRLVPQVVPSSLRPRHARRSNMGP